MRTPPSTSPPADPDSDRIVTLAEQTAARIIALVEETDLRPGDEIPAEAELARSFEVSRLTVREAIRVLTSRDILVSSQGKQARVTVPGSRVLGQVLGFRLRQRTLRLEELIEARRTIEGRLTRRAAERIAADEATTERAELSLARMVAAVDDREQFIASDIDFHREIANLGANTLLDLMLDSFRSILLEARRSSYAGRRHAGEQQNATIVEHRAVLDAIRNGDPERAVAAMEMHLQHTERDLRAALRAEGIS